MSTSRVRRTMHGAVLLLAAAGLACEARAPEDPSENAAPDVPTYTPAAASAPSTDIYLASLTLDADTVSVTDVRNVTARPGYDNQPAFESGGESFLYASVRDAQQSDIYRYDIMTGTSQQVTRTPVSEFSPTLLPSGVGFSSIHESATGQLLWRYGADGTSLGGILEGVQPVGYHGWGDENRVLMFVLGRDGGPDTLHLGDVRDGSASVLAENPGRSLHKVPGRHAVSFVRKVADDDWWIEVLDLDSGEFTRLLRTRPGREDFAWTPDGRLVQGDGSRLFVARPGEDWVEVADLASAGVVDISRIAISETGTHIAIVGDRPD